MKRKYTAFVGILLAIMIGVTIVIAANHNDNRALNLTDAQDRAHTDDDDQDNHSENDPDDHDSDSEINAEGKHEEGENEESDHDEESGNVEMTRAQQEEIGLIVTTAHSADIEHILSFVGEVRLHEDRIAHLVPRVSGIVRSVSASLGKKVREGEVLAVIDSPELAELKADYLEKLRNLELTRRTFERKQYLKQENIASEADWLEAQSAFQNAETVLHSAKRRLIVLGMGDEEILGLPNAKDESFGRYALKSPIAGTIITKHITRGEKIGEDEVFTVADLSVVWVDLQVPAKDLGRVRVGLPVVIISTTGTIADGNLSLVGPVVDVESRTALGRVILANTKGLWKPGLFVTGQLQSKTSSSAVVVPSEAVQNIDGENIIFVPDGDEFKPVEVTLGRIIKDKTEILAGLKGGDRYVAKGAFDLKAVHVTSGAGDHAGHGH